MPDSAEITRLNAVTNAWGARVELMLGDRAVGVAGRYATAALLLEAQEKWYEYLLGLVDFYELIVRPGVHDAEVHTLRPDVARLEELLHSCSSDGRLDRPQIVESRSDDRADFRLALDPDVADSDAHAALQRLGDRSATAEAQWAPISAVIGEIAEWNRDDDVDLQLEAARQARLLNPNAQITIDREYIDVLGRRLLETDTTAAAALGEFPRAERPGRGFVYAVYPPAPVFTRVADWSCLAWLQGSSGALEAEIRQRCEDPGEFIEHMVAGLQTCLMHHISLEAAAGTTTRSRRRQRNSPIPPPPEGLIARLQSNFLSDERLGLSDNSKREILLAFGGSEWFDVTFLQPLLHRRRGQRVAALKALVLYAAYVVRGVVLTSSGPDAVLRGSLEADIFYVYREAYRCAEYCSLATSERSPGTGDEAAVARAASLAISRAGLFLAERPEAWLGHTEELLRDATLPFLLTAGFNAEGEARVYSGKSDILFRYGALGSESWHRGVVEFKWWDGISTFRRVWRQLTVEHATGHESYLAAVILYQGRDTSDVLEQMSSDLETAWGIAARPRHKGSGTLAGLDGHACVHGSTPIPFGIYLYDLHYRNPRR